MFELGTVGDGLATEMGEAFWGDEVFFLCDHYSRDSPRLICIYIGIVWWVGQDKALIGCLVVLVKVCRGRSLSYHLSTLIYLLLGNCS